MGGIAYRILEGEIIEDNNRILEGENRSEIYNLTDFSSS